MLAFVACSKSSSATSFDENLPNAKLAERSVKGGPLSGKMSLPIEMVETKVEEQKFLFTSPPGSKFKVEIHLELSGGTKPDSLDEAMKRLGLDETSSSTIHKTVDDGTQMAIVRSDAMGAVTTVWRKTNLEPIASRCGFIVNGDADTKTMEALALFGLQVCQSHKVMHE